MDIKKELQARLDLVTERVKQERFINTKPYRIYFRGFAAGRMRGYVAEMYYLTALIEKLEE